MTDLHDIVAVMDKAACVLAAKGADLLAERLQVAAMVLSSSAGEASDVVAALQRDIDAYGKTDIRQAELDSITAWNTRPALLRDAGDGARLDWLCSGDLKMVEESPARCFRVYRDIAPPDDEHARWQALTEAVFPTARAAIDAAMHAPGGG